MTGADGLGRIGDRAEEARGEHQCGHRAPGPAAAPPYQREGHQGQRGQRPGDDDDPADGRVPRRGAVEQDPGPGRGARHHEGGGQPGPDGVPSQPELVGANGHEGGDGRSEGDGVIGVDDAGAGGPDPIRARRMSAGDQNAGQADQ